MEDLYANRNQTFLKFVVTISEFTNVIEVGHELQSLGVDDLFTGGFWIYDPKTQNEFYSNKLRQSMGYKDEKDFPNNSGIWMHLIDKDDLIVAMENIALNIKTNGAYPYYQTATYKKKNGGYLQVLCSGKLVEKNGSKWIVGTHNILQEW